MSTASQRLLPEGPNSGLDAEHEEQPRVISVAPFFQFLARYHRVLLLGLVGLVVAWAAGISLLRFALPGVKTSNLGIRFTFQGTGSARYPNGLPFSPNDVIAPEILEQVYADNELAGALPFESFKKAIFISQSNRALDQLQNEYAIKLRDSRISTPERRQLEKEFLAAADGLRTDSYLITYRAKGQSTLPPGLDEQVLLSIPATWARFSAEKRGVLSYDVEIPTGTAIGEIEPGLESALRSGEILRMTSANLRAAAARLAKVPGAQLARGDRGEALMDLATEIDIFDSVTILPAYLTAIQVAGSGNPRDVDTLLTYRLESRRRAQRVAEARALELERALRAYTTHGVPVEMAASVDADGGEPGRARPLSGSGSGVIAQVGAGFLDEILRAKDNAQDAKYRQELNDRVVKAKMDAVDLTGEVQAAQFVLDQSRGALQQGRQRSLAEFEETARSARATLQEFAVRLRTFFDRISQRNLNPDSTLYLIERPYFAQQASAIDLSRAVLGGFGFVTLGLLAMIGMCAALASRRSDHVR